MSSRHRFKILSVITFAALALVGTAIGGNPHGIDLQTPKAVSVNYTHCVDRFGNPLPCVAVEYTITNNTNQTIMCLLYVKEIDFTVPFDPIASGQTAGGGLVTGYTGGMKRLTFVLFCDGSIVRGETEKVRIRLK